MKKLILLFLLFLSSISSGQDMLLYDGTNFWTYWNGATTCVEVVQSSPGEPYTMYATDHWTNSASPALGFIRGAWADYENTTQVVFNVGEGFLANGNHWYIDSAFTSTVSTLAAGADFHYGYVDETASGALDSSDIVWSTTEPAEDEYGWYNGNDRCIFSVYSPAGGATNLRFTVVGADGSALKAAQARRFTAASNMNPDSTWQTPDDGEVSTFVPVHASGVLLIGRGADANNNSTIMVTQKEQADWAVALHYEWAIYAVSYRFSAYARWVGLGASRNVRIMGENDDDNSMNLWIEGWEIER